MTPTEDDAAARKARAARLREQIARLKSHASGDSAPPQDPSGESAREFVERRMREQQEKEEGTSSQDA